jgi:hypothetical protein
MAKKANNAVRKVKPIYVLGIAHGEGVQEFCIVPSKGIFNGLDRQDALASREYEKNGEKWQRFESLQDLIRHCEENHLRIADSFLAIGY